MSVYEWEYWWAPSGGQIVPVGQANESDTGLAVNPVHVVNVAIANELDSALAVGDTQLVTVGLAQEIDSGQAVTSKHIVLVTQAGEANSGTVAGSRHVVLVGLTNEIDSALVVNPVGPIVVNVDVATETDVALDVTPITGPGSFSWATYGGRGLHRVPPKPKPVTKVIDVELADEYDTGFDCKPEIIKPLYVSDIVPPPVAPKPIPRKPARIVQAVTVDIAESDELFQEHVMQLELLGVI